MRLRTPPGWLTAVAVAGCGGRATNIDGATVRDAATEAGSLPRASQSCNGASDGAVVGSCGAGGESCCARLDVPGGHFGGILDSPRFSGGVLPASVSSFMLDKFEVSVGRFRRFVDSYAGVLPAAGQGGNASVANSGWRPEWPLASTDELRAALAACGGTWTPEAGANERKPIDCITWYEAFAFCAWDGGRLPTLIEHNYVALGGDEERSYPWSPESDAGTIDSMTAVFGQPEAGTGPLDVGSRPNGAGRWGHQDLSGNAAEWALDAYPPLCVLGSNPCDSCACVEPDAMNGRVDYGGSFADPLSALASMSFNGVPAEGRYQGIGVRCAGEAR